MISFVAEEALRDALDELSTADKRRRSDYIRIKLAEVVRVEKSLGKTERAYVAATEGAAAGQQARSAKGKK